MDYAALNLVEDAAVGKANCVRLTVWFGRPVLGLNAPWNCDQRQRNGGGTVVPSCLQAPAALAIPRSSGILIRCSEDR